MSNNDLRYHLAAIRRVLVKQFPDQIRDEGRVDTSEWSALHEADSWLTDNAFVLTKAEADGFRALLLWVQNTVNSMLNWMREQIASERASDDMATRELRLRFEQLRDEYDEHARVLLATSDKPLEESILDQTVH